MKWRKWKLQAIFILGIFSLAIAIVLSIPVFSNSSLAFKHIIVDPDPPSGSNCCLDVLSVGDLDGDKKPDIAVGSQNSIGAVWYQNPSWKRYVISAGEFTTDGEIADLDNDGDGDIVFSDYGKDAIAWWENKGQPFSPSGWERHEIRERFAHDISVGDLNGDRNLDVVIFRKDNPRQLTWFEAPNDPRQLWTRHTIDTPLGEGLDLGDLDGDGDFDIAAGTNWYENASTKGQQWNKHPFAPKNWGELTRDIIADMNGDGKRDIVLSHAEGEGRVSWFENPTWVEHIIEPESLRGAHSLEVADFDADGDRDVFVGEMNTGGGRVMVYENLDRADRWSRSILASTGTHNAIVRDMNGDDKPDIIGKNYTKAKLVEIWQNATITGKV
ncbi:MAG: VCBS repeat-containing protein [Hydrococcus sp. Prado102]|jgi:hypothetical protein|nr:VCBS repeat-containing protein [Hydrococcus sp. Prado102]